ncbi:MAG: RsmG family class I SAM-dependent methyltransferase [Polyangiales bacterium]
MAFFELTQAWDVRTDLTSARSDTELSEILFLDAAHVIRAGWAGPSASFVDIGAGVGAPTIPILLSNETLRGTLVEPRRIRAAFLRTAIGALGLTTRATILEQRVDAAKPSVRGVPFGVALSRATFAPDVWLRIGAQLANEVWVLTAGSEPEAKGALSLDRRLDYEVPSSGAPRSILAYRS